MALIDNFRFFITFPNGTFEAMPDNATIKIVDEKDKTYGFARKKIATDLIFYNDVNQTYNNIAAYEKDDSICIAFPLLIQVRHDETTWVNYLQATIPIRSGKVNRDLCRYTVRPRVVDAFTCLLDNHKKEKNLLQIANKQTIAFVQGEIQEHICTQLASNNPSAFVLSQIPSAQCTGITSANGWTITSNILTGVSQIATTPFAQFRVEIKIVSVYKREFVSGVTSPGLGWIAVDGGFAKPINAKFDTANSTNTAEFVNSGRNEIVQRWVTVGFDNDTNEIDSFDNGVKLEDALDYLLEACGIEIVSDFFNVRPDDTAPSNKEYQYAANFLHEIMIYQASDIIRASALNNATRMDLSFYELWQNLKRFNVEMFDQDGSIRIEHISYLQKQRGLSLLGSLYKYIEGRNEFDYDESELPRFEIFKDKYDTFGRDFDEAKIEYNAECSAVEENDTKTIISPNVVCNIEYLYNNALINEDTEKMVKVIVFISTSSNQPITSVGVITNTPGVNRCMAMANIIESLWLHGRPQPSGLVNNKPFVFDTFIKRRKPPKLDVVICLSDYVEQFSASKYVETQLGWCDIDSAEYDTRTKVLSLSVRG